MLKGTYMFIDLARREILVSPNLQLCREFAQVHSKGCRVKSTSSRK